MLESLRWRTSFALLLIVVLVVPLLVACGGPAAPAATVPEATTATEPTAAPPATVGESATTDSPEATMDTTDEATAEATEAGTETPEAGTEPAPAGAGGDTSPAGNIIRVNTTEPDNTDPQRASFVNEIGLIMLNYMGLMTFNTELKPVPGAAEKVDISADGLTYRFSLRPNQKYSDGEPLTARNFEYAWKRLCDPSVAGEYQTSGYPIAGCQEYAEAFSTAGLTVTDVAQLQALRDKVAAKALDDNTLEIKLKEPAGYFLNVAAIWVGVPTRQDLVEQGGENWWSDPANYIGNGPFQMAEWEHQSRIRFERNENFALEARTPKFEGIEFTEQTEGNVVFESYRAGELDYIGLGAEDLETVESDPQLKAQRADVGGSCTFYLGFNNAARPFDNKQVRQAFATALNREAWVRDILKGLGKPALSFIPPGFPGHDAQENRFAFNKEQAQQLLNASGYDKNQTLKLTYGSTARNKARNEYLASMLQENLGVKIQLDPVDPTVYSSLFRRGETTPPLFILGWCADYPDPQNWTSLVFQTGGIGAGRIRWSSPQLDQLTKRADTLKVDDPQRAALHAQAQDLLVEEAPVAFFWHDVHPTLVKPWVKNVHQTPLDWFPGIFDLGSIEIAH